MLITKSNYLLGCLKQAAAADVPDRIIAKVAYCSCNTNYFPMTSLERVLILRHKMDALHCPVVLEQLAERMQ